MSVRAVVGVVAWVWLAMAPAAHAGCGPLNQPCQPPAGPAAPLVLSAAENPFGLTELPVRTSNDPLYPAVSGHTPYGLNDNVTDTTDPVSYDWMGDAVAGAGGAMVRTVLEWPSFEPNNDDFRFDYTDELYKRFIRHGIRPAFWIHGTPLFMTNVLERDDPFFCGGPFCTAEPDQVRAQQELYSLGFQLSRRYPLLAALEYRNEPDIPVEDRPMIPKERYATNLAAFYEGARAGRASTRVWGGALAGGPNLSTYVKTVWSHSGVKGKVDALSFHPYDQDAEYRHMRHFFIPIDTGLAQAGEWNVRLVASEFGVTQRPNDFTNHDFANGDDQPGNETVFDRFSKQWNDLNRLNPARVAPVPELPRIDKLDAAIMFSAVEWRPPGHGHDGYGWVETKVNGQPSRPNHVWCAWRAQVAGLPAWPGSQHVATCPTSWAGP